MSRDQVIAAWAASGSGTRRTAATLARDLLAEGLSHTRVDSAAKIAKRLGTSPTMADNARRMLMGQGIVYKIGRHYYVA
jgi:hypothetical protein